MTPAPWTYRAIAPGCRRTMVVSQRGTPYSSPDVYSSHGGFVADCGSHEQSNANARLIAAAPDLLAALKEVEEYFLSSPYATDSGQELRDVQAAIAKAEGR